MLAHMSLMFVKRFFNMRLTFTCLQILKMLFLADLIIKKIILNVTLTPCILELRF